MLSSSRNIFSFRLRTDPAAFSRSVTFIVSAEDAANSPGYFLPPDLDRKYQTKHGGGEGLNNKRTKREIDVNKQRILGDFELKFVEWGH